jgi:predicted nucleotidyltransferase component of viral defense system
MKKEPVKNIAASVRTQLRSAAQRLDVPFAEILQYYGMERFLQRLSKSNYGKSFVLKGGFLLYGWHLPLRRPTRDIDLRGYLENSSKTMLDVMQAVIALPIKDDGIVFDAETLTVEQTQIDADYQGIRVKFTGHLGNAKIPIQIDIGFSDVILDRTLRIDFPTLLDESESLKLKCYPKESIVSEKFHAMIHHAELNSRLKDYYDIWLLSKTFEFDGPSLQKAIAATFKQRETPVTTERPPALSLEFASANRARWKTFLVKMNRTPENTADFLDVVDAVWTFLGPSLRVFAGKTLHWHPSTGWQEENSR